MHLEGAVFNVGIRIAHDTRREIDTVRLCDPRHYLREAVSKCCAMTTYVGRKMVALFRQKYGSWKYSTSALGVHAPLITLEETFMRVYCSGHSKPRGCGRAESGTTMCANLPTQLQI
jgi:hypothetical protein